MIVMMPAYISYFTIGFGNDKKIWLFLRAAGFILGFSLVFVSMGATATAVSSMLLSNRKILTRISGMIIIIFGLYMVGAFNWTFLFKEYKIFKFSIKDKWYSSFLLGIAFASGWTPCVGPTLMSVLAYAGSTSSVRLGVIYLSVYSLGMAIPLILAAVFTNWVSDKVYKYSKYSTYLEKAAGVFLLLFGTIIFTNSLSKFNGYLNFINDFIIKLEGGFK